MARHLVLSALLAACASPPAARDAAPPADASPDAAPDATTDAATDTDADTDAATDASPARLRVLFVGNSYTFYNDLPAMVRTLAASTGGAPPVEVDSVAEGGASFRSHWERGVAQARIRDGAFTHVVLQGQSVEPCLDPTTFHTWAVRFANEARAAGATPVFFETWARRAGDAVYAQRWSGGTPDAMQACLSRGYAEAARASGATVAPVGAAWRSSLASRPALALHDPDGSHPNVAGTYLAASVLAAVVARASPRDATARPAGLAEADAAHLRDVAARATGTP